MENFDENTTSPSYMLSEQSPLEVMEILIFELKAKGFTYRIHNKKWQLTFDAKENLDANPENHNVQPGFCKI